MSSVGDITHIVYNQHLLNEKKDFGFNLNV